MGGVVATAVTIVIGVIVGGVAVEGVGMALMFICLTAFACGCCNSR